MKIFFKKKKKRYDSSFFWFSPSEVQPMNGWSCEDFDISIEDFSRGRKKNDNKSDVCQK